MGETETETKRRRILWTDEQDEYLKANYPGISVRKLALHFSRSQDAVSCRIKMLGLSKPRTEEEYGFAWVEKQMKLDENGCTRENVYALILGYPLDSPPVHPSRTGLEPCSLPPKSNYNNNNF
jgi:hypothetical protein